VQPLIYVLSDSFSTKLSSWWWYLVITAQSCWFSYLCKINLSVQQATRNKINRSRTKYRDEENLPNLQPLILQLYPYGSLEHISFQAGPKFQYMTALYWNNSSFNSIDNSITKVMLLGWLLRYKMILISRQTHNSTVCVWLECLHTMVRPHHALLAVM